jgi:hypothetical protein
LIAQTNALGGVTTYVESYDPTTGGLIRTTTNPDGSTIIDKYFLDGTLKMHTGTAVHGVRYTNYFISSGFLPVGSAEIKLNANGTDSSEGVTNYDDVFGRVFETQYNDGSFCTNWYNTLGQLTVQEDPDGVMKLFQYDAKREQTYTILDMEQDWMADWTGTNQITMVTNDVTTDHGTNVLRTRTYAWTANGVNSSNLISLSETSTTGLLSWQTQYSASGVGVTNETQTVYGANLAIIEFVQCCLLITKTLSNIDCIHCQTKCEWRLGYLVASECLEIM